MAARSPQPGVRPRRVLIVHNEYQQRGGENAVVEAEVELLRHFGHQVAQYQRHNDEVMALSPLHLAADTLWSTRSQRELQALGQEFVPEIVHVHNTFPLISPSIYAAARQLRAPVLQTLHNFRLLCPQASLFRDGRPCQDCVGRVPWRAVRHRCYRASALHSAALATMLQAHRLRGTWRDDVTLYIALNHFSADLFERGGLPPQRLRIKPNFLDLPAPPEQPRHGLIFVGRLTADKGVALLAAAAAQRVDAAPITVIGDGPARAALERQPGLRCLGPLPPSEVLQHMRQAAALVLPSLCAEVFPRTLVEAFGCALPVIASRVGALPELIEEGHHGWLFDPTRPDELVALLRAAEAQPAELRRRGQAAREHHQRHWTGIDNHRQLMALYNEALSLFDAMPNP